MSALSSLTDLIERLSDARVLCVGDVMLDRYVMGEVERISPEAPIPVLRVERETTMLGGAGNVASNIAALGGGGHFIAVVGDDAAGAEITRLLADLKTIHADLMTQNGRHTTLKTRFIGANQQMMRADVESTTALDASTQSQLL
ncbi:MAG: bifunctional heptose 7-phosphate kinase/heptose 1-phosphate adenyltransferase, partial [Magnetovibrio sp.]|nr:bifunctional heptose 7-phosphate kinase/heptose 1-phosphate adenyltransferase [Magnetovibrio sp.]